MKKIYSVLITIILLLNSINVIAIDDEVSKALANTREEYSEYIEKAIEKTGIDKNNIDTDRIAIVKVATWEQIENDNGQLCILLPLMEKDEYYFTVFANDECQVYWSREKADVFFSSKIAYENFKKKTYIRMLKRK